MSGELSKRFLSVLDRVERAARVAKRKVEEIQVVSVSKGQPIVAMQELIALNSALGRMVVFGENYVQEWRSKKTALLGSYLTRMIGPLQRNKAKAAVELFDSIDSVHSVPLLEALEDAAKGKELTREIYLQANISNDPAKSGFLPDELLGVAERVCLSSNLDLKGLMTITKLFDNPEDVRPDFREMRKLHAQVCEKLGRSLELSMGMSSDYQIAIEEGATVVRVGTAIFGERV